MPEIAVCPKADTHRDRIAVAARVEHRVAGVFRAAIDAMPGRGRHVGLVVGGAMLPIGLGDPVAGTFGLPYAERRLILWGKWPGHANKAIQGEVGRMFNLQLSDGTVTNSTWKAQSFYIAPLQHPDDVVEYGNIHDTSHLGGRIHPLAKLPTCREHCFAIHYPIPDGWMNPNFDKSKWPQAFEYLDQEVGIMGVPGYWRYPEAFIGGRWIWTISLVFDNTVLLRKTVQ